MDVADMAWVDNLLPRRQLQPPGEQGEGAPFLLGTESDSQEEEGNQEGILVAPE
jgi:hypothetical protein